MFRFITKRKLLVVVPLLILSYLLLSFRVIDLDDFLLEHLAFYRSARETNPLLNFSSMGLRFSQKLVVINWLTAPLIFILIVVNIFLSFYQFLLILDHYIKLVTPVVIDQQLFFCDRDSFYKSWPVLQILSRIFLSPVLALIIANIVEVIRNKRPDFLKKLPKLKQASLLKTFLVLSFKLFLELTIFVPLRIYLLRSKKESFYNSVLHKIYQSEEELDLNLLTKRETLITVLLVIVETLIEFIDIPIIRTLTFFKKVSKDLNLEEISKINRKALANSLQWTFNRSNFSNSILNYFIFNPLSDIRDPNSFKNLYSAILATCLSDLTSQDRADQVEKWYLDPLSRAASCLFYAKQSQELQDLNSAGAYRFKLADKLANQLVSLVKEEQQWRPIKNCQYRAIKNLESFTNGEGLYYQKEPLSQVLKDLESLRVSYTEVKAIDHGLQYSNLTDLYNLQFDNKNEFFITGSKFIDHDQPTGNDFVCLKWNLKPIIGQKRPDLKKLVSQSNFSQKDEFISNYNLLKQDDPYQRPDYQEILKIDQLVTNQRFKSDLKLIIGTKNSKNLEVVSLKGLEAKNLTKTEDKWLYHFYLVPPSSIVNQCPVIIDNLDRVNSQLLQTRAISLDDSLDLRLNLSNLAGKDYYQRIVNCLDLIGLRDQKNKELNSIENSIKGLLTRLKTLSNRTGTIDSSKFKLKENQSLIKSPSNNLISPYFRIMFYLNGYSRQNCYNSVKDPNDKLLITTQEDQFYQQLELLLSLVDQFWQNNRPDSSSDSDLKFLKLSIGLLKDQIANSNFFIDPEIALLKSRTNIRKSYRNFNQKITKIITDNPLNQKIRWFDQSNQDSFKINCNEESDDLFDLLTLFSLLIAFRDKNDSSQLRALNSPSIKRYSDLEKEFIDSKTRPRARQTRTPFYKNVLLIKPLEAQDLLEKFKDDPKLRNLLQDNDISLTDLRDLSKGLRLDDQRSSTCYLEITRDLVDSQSLQENPDTRLRYTISELLYAVDYNLLVLVSRYLPLMELGSSSNYLNSCYYLLKDIQGLRTNRNSGWLEVQENQLPAFILAESQDLRELSPWISNSFNLKIKEILFYLIVSISIICDLILAINIFQQVTFILDTIERGIGVFTTNINRASWFVGLTGRFFNLNLVTNFISSISSFLQQSQSREYLTKVLKEVDFKPMIADISQKNTTEVLKDLQNFTTTISKGLIEVGTSSLERLGLKIAPSDIEEPIKRSTIEELVNLIDSKIISKFYNFRNYLVEPFDQTFKYFGQIRILILVILIRFILFKSLIRQLEIDNYLQKTSNIVIKGLEVFSRLKTLIVMVINFKTFSRIIKLLTGLDLEIKIFATNRNCILTIVVVSILIFKLTRIKNNCKIDQNDYQIICNQSLSDWWLLRENKILEAQTPNQANSTILCQKFKPDILKRKNLLNRPLGSFINLDQHLIDLLRTNFRLEQTPRIIWQLNLRKTLNLVLWQFVFHLVLLSIYQWLGLESSILLALILVLNSKFYILKELKKLNGLKLVKFSSIVLIINLILKIIIQIDQDIKENYHDIGRFAYFTSYLKKLIVKVLSLYFFIMQTICSLLESKRKESRIFSIVFFICLIIVLKLVIIKFNNNPKLLKVNKFINFLSIFLFFYYLQIVVFLVLIGRTNQENNIITRDKKIISNFFNNLDSFNRDIDRSIQELSQKNWNLSLFTRFNTKSLFCNYIDHLLDLLLVPNRIILKGSIGEFSEEGFIMAIRSYLEDSLIITMVLHLIIIDRLSQFKIIVQLDLFSKKFHQFVQDSTIKTQLDNHDTKGLIFSNDSLIDQQLLQKIVNFSLSKLKNNCLREEFRPFSGRRIEIEIPDDLLEELVSRPMLNDFRVYLIDLSFFTIFLNIFNCYLLDNFNYSLNSHDFNRLIDRVLFKSLWNTLLNSIKWGLAGRCKNHMMIEIDKTNNLLYIRLADSNLRVFANWKIFRTLIFDLLKMQDNSFRVNLSKLENSNFVGLNWIGELPEPLVQDQSCLNSQLEVWFRTCSLIFKITSQERPLKLSTWDYNITIEILKKELLPLASLSYAKLYTINIMSILARRQDKNLKQLHDIEVKLVEDFLQNTSEFINLTDRETSDQETLDLMINSLELFEESIKGLFTKYQDRSKSPLTAIYCLRDPRTKEDIINNFIKNINSTQDSQLKDLDPGNRSLIAKKLIDFIQAYLSTSYRINPLYYELISQDLRVENPEASTSQIYNLVELEVKEIEDLLGREELIRSTNIRGKIETGYPETIIGNTREGLLLSKGLRPPQEVLELLNGQEPLLQESFFSLNLLDILKYNYQKCLSSRPSSNTDIALRDLKTLDLVKIIILKSWLLFDWPFETNQNPDYGVIGPFKFKLELDNQLAQRAGFRKFSSEILKFLDYLSSFNSLVSLEQEKEDLRSKNLRLFLIS